MLLLARYSQSAIIGVYVIIFGAGKSSILGGRVMKIAMLTVGVMIATGLLGTTF